jgi:hypothetical protein
MSELFVFSVLFETSGVSLDTTVRTESFFIEKLGGFCKQASDAMLRGFKPSGTSGKSILTQ